MQVRAEGYKISAKADRPEYEQRMKMDRNLRVLGVLQHGLPPLLCEPHRRRWLNLWRFQSRGRTPINPPQVVPPDQEDFHSHFQSVAQGVDLGAVVMCPLHRDLDSAQVELVGQKKQLWIKAPALDMLARENGLYRPPTERLEAALRVAVLESQYDS